VGVQVLKRRSTDRRRPAPRSTRTGSCSLPVTRSRQCLQGVGCSSRVTEPAESWLQQQSYRACRELVAAAELQSLQRVGCSAELQSLQRVGCSSRVQATRVGVETAHLGLPRRGRQGRRNNASSGLGRRLHSWMGHRAMGAMLIQPDRLT
jgi:hypothetical protein